ncbi:hypothetical protein M514_06058 [Trichuris suis]|uniref:Secreted protein n=1 Tax=Trichuris suis TaxID=68888 RepID=A0A085M7E8_9BILA|nr:hypothetical protein M513_06058 [Trichuris suis]KFD70708.1 hypothetical protein M514_06058 [Trichuris suis]
MYAAVPFFSVLLAIAAGQCSLGTMPSAVKWLCGRLVKGFRRRCCLQIIKDACHRRSFCEAVPLTLAVTAPTRLTIYRRTTVGGKSCPRSSTIAWRRTACRPYDELRQSASTNHTRNPMVKSQNRDDAAAAAGRFAQCLLG